MSISVVINTYNATEHLERVMSYLKDFREVVVCDMESTDGTPELARSLGARVITFKKGNYNHAEPARTTAIQAAKADWVLVVDADEIVPRGLRDYLYKFVKSPGETRGIYIPRKNHLFDKFDRSTYPDYQLRFFKKEGTVWPPEVHSLPKVNGKLEKIPANRTELALVHLQHDLYGMMTRMNNYTSAEVIRRGADKPVTMMELWLKPVVRFMKSYFVKGGWRMGMAGYITACNNAYYKYVMLAKMYEKRAMDKFHEQHKAEEDKK